MARESCLTKSPVVPSVTFRSADETSNQSYETPATAESDFVRASVSSRPAEPVTELDSANGR